MRTVIVLACLAFPSAAVAAEVHVSADASGHRHVHYTGGPERNSVSATFGIDDVTIADRRAAVTAGEGCTAIDANTARCPAGALRMNLGGARDIADIVCPETPALCGSATIFGGAADDSLSGTDRADRLDGGTGDDYVYGGGGIDFLYGGPGNDRLVPGPNGGDERLPRLFCGAGRDEIVAQALITLDCERFRQFTQFDPPEGRMEVHGDRVTIGIRRTDCPWDFFIRSHTFARRTAFHPRSWSPTTLTLPHDGGPSPHLYGRQSCGGDRYRMLFRLRNPFG